MTRRPITLHHRPGMIWLALAATLALAALALALPGLGEALLRGAPAALDFGSKGAGLACGAWGLFEAWGKRRGRRRRVGRLVRRAQ